MAAVASTMLPLVDAMLAGKPPVDPQRASIGCNIKWKPGNEPDYFTPKT